MNNSRAIIIVAFVFVLFLVLIGRLFDVQILRSEELKYYAQRQQTTVEKVKAERGMIYDRNNVLLVYNRNDVSYFLDLRMASVKDRSKIAAKFSSVFGKSRNYYLNLMANSDRTICIEKKAPADKASVLKGFKANGLFSRDDPTRVYFYKDLAAHLLGYVGPDYRGVNGIAKSFDDELAGEDGSMVVLRDAIGDMITVEEKETKPARPGLNLYLTINKSYQAILDEELLNGLKKYGGSSAVGIIMDPNTGEILALANQSDFDPNEYWKYDDSDRRDRAITDTYEPGSTMKSITLSALLDKHLCRENERIDVENGRYKFKNINIIDSHKESWLTVKGVLEQSSDIGMTKLIQRMDNDTFYKYLRAFGFGNFTSVPLPGEVRGSLRKPNDWSAVTKVFMSFGYGVAVTPIQIVTAYCALVNGGILYQPEIIKKEVKHDGTVVLDNSPREVRRVISAETSMKMRELLKGVVDNGTGENARLNNVSIGGKTGTSQRLVDGKYSKSEYHTSFVGFFPVENPKILCLILVNSPKEEKYGGSVAAPIFKNVAERIIKTNTNLFESPVQSLPKIDKEIKVALKDKGADKDYADVTASGQKLTKIVKSDVMPDLKKYSLRDAISVLSRLGLKYKVSGAGKIVAQSIPPGEKIQKGILCTLDCREAVLNGAAVY